MTVEELVECAACGGCGVDEGGEVPTLCVACHGFGSLSWRRVVWLGMVDRYDRLTQVQQGAEYVRQATERVS